MSLAASADAPQVQPGAETGRRPCNVAICLTPHAFIPEPCPGYQDDARWVREWALNPRKPMAALCARLGRPAAALVVIDQPESGDVEIRGPIAGYDKLVPLALVAHGLTAAQCVAGLRDLARSRP